jgi:hypothetical protein
MFVRVLGEQRWPSYTQKKYRLLLLRAIAAAAAAAAD